MLGKCREGVDDSSCDCPCYVEKACLSDLFKTDEQRYFGSWGFPVQLPCRGGEILSINLSYPIRNSRLLDLEHPYGISNSSTGDYEFYLEKTALPIEFRNFKYLSCNKFKS